MSRAVAAVPAADERSTAPTGPRLIAFYLPQYHPIPENDAWWGPGFTEWTNVAKARPQFPGHYQPHLPADLGFYDLRLPETRTAQADLARRYGIHGFCYYHYWFGGRRLLERPFNEVLANGEPDFPFCLCWANENWTRVWDGGSKQVLLTQSYSAEDDRAHIRWLLQAFHDPRYIRVDNKPLFLVYRASQLPDPRRTTDLWRAEAARDGVGDLYLCRVDSFGTELTDPRALGFDAAVEFTLDTGAAKLPPCDSFINRVLARLGVRRRRALTHDVFEYATVVDRMLARRQPAYPQFQCVTPSWDNTARRAVGAIIIQGSTPALYQRWLREVLSHHRDAPTGGSVVFINAWNEWAEGNHLEPDQRFGRAYLDATRSALQEVSAV